MKLGSVQFRLLESGFFSGLAELNYLPGSIYEDCMIVTQFQYLVEIPLAIIAVALC